MGGRCTHSFRSRSVTQVANSECPSGSWERGEKNTEAERTSPYRNAKAMEATSAGSCRRVPSSSRFHLRHHALRQTCSSESPCLGRKDYSLLHPFYIYFILFYVYKCFAYKYLCAPCVCLMYKEEMRRGLSLVNGVTYGSEPPHRC